MTGGRLNLGRITQALRGTARTVAQGRPALYASVGMLGGVFGALAGLGGGVVMTPFLVQAGLTQHAAQAASLAAVVSTGMLGTAGYARALDIDVEASALMCAGAMVTVPLGARLAFRVSSRSLSKVFGAFLLVCGPTVPLLHTSALADLHQRLHRHERSALVFCAVGCVAGFASGLLGVGGGAVMTPLLAGLTDLPHHAVLGTSLAAMVLPSLASLYAHASRGAFSLAVGLPLAAGAVVGSTCGVAGALRTDEQSLRMVFALCLLVTGLRMLLK